MDVVKLILPNRNQTEFQIALVDEPAIESEFMMFNKHNRFQFKEVEGEENLLMGYFMIADMEILRMDEKRGAYKVVFPKESIDTIVENFSLNGLNKNMNEMHNTGNLTEGVFVKNHWQLDSKKGIGVPNGFKTEADGSWFGVVKCENPEVKEKVKQGLYKGFSIESRFIEEAIDKYFAVDDTNTDNKNLYNKFKDKMNELKELLTALKSVFEKETPAVTEPAKTEKFEELLLVDGTTKVTIEPAVEVGAAIVLYDAEGNPVPAPVGSYELQDGRVIVVEADGVIASITEPMAEGEEEMEGEIKKDAAPANESVKRLIERIEKVSEYSAQVEDLKKENDFLHKELDALKIQNAEFKKQTEETFAKLLSEPAKEPVKQDKKWFPAKEERETKKYSWEK